MEQVAYALPGAIATYSAKSALFSSTAADRGTFYDSTGSFTITLDTTSMPAGWSAWFRSVSGTQVLDPSGATLINGAATYSVANAGDVVLVEYTGSAFVISQSQLVAGVAITGGTINGTTIGGVTPVSATFTNIIGTAATGSTSTTTGALILAGGIGTAGAINAAGTIAATTAFKHASSDASSITFTGSNALTGTYAAFAVLGKSHATLANQMFFDAAITTFRSASGTYLAKIDANGLGAGQTVLFIYDNDNATVEQVTVGIADSGGVGFKLLRIPN